ncbi:DPEP2 neighbor protein [Manis javanica]|uniref:DPEP2 neighbor protein n=1 Tax=Manis javanica TaxID=9974 RepID=UPI003C6CEFBA
MSGWINHMRCGLSSVPWEGCAAGRPRRDTCTRVIGGHTASPGCHMFRSGLPATPRNLPRAAAGSPSPTPGYCHLLYQGRGETQVTWHGETYCLVGGCRSYGDAPMATPAKVKAEKPVPRRAPKRHATSASDEELGCPPPKIRRLQHRGKGLTPQKLAGHATCVRRARV